MGRELPFRLSQRLYPVQIEFPECFAFRAIGQQQAALTRMHDIDGQHDPPCRVAVPVAIGDGKRAGVHAGVMDLPGIDRNRRPVHRSVGLEQLSQRQQVARLGQVPRDQVQSRQRIRTQRVILCAQHRFDSPELKVQVLQAGPMCRLCLRACGCPRDCGKRQGLQECASVRRWIALHFGYFVIWAWTDIRIFAVLAGGRKPDAT